jgi:hypothetical protein
LREGGAGDGAGGGRAERGAEQVAAVEHGRFLSVQ